MEVFIGNPDFFTAAIVAPLMSDLAAVARGIPGIGCKTMYPLVLLP